MSVEIGRAALDARCKAVLPWLIPRVTTTKCSACPGTRTPRPSRTHSVGWLAAITRTPAPSPRAAERFKEIAEAYGVLSDPARRSTYDADGFARYAGPAPEDVWAGIDFGDILGAGGPGLGANLFERLFGRPFGTSPRRGGYLKVDLTIPLQQILTGSKQDITLPQPGACRKCSGSGADPATPPRHCAACTGTGQQTTAGQHGNLSIRQVIICPACQGPGRRH